MRTACTYDAIFLSLLMALGLGCADRSPSLDSSGGDGGNTDDGETVGAEAGETGEPPEPFECENPVVILQTGTELPTGFVSCDGGFIHRAEALESVNPQPADDPSCLDNLGAFCLTGADCVDQAYGACQSYVSAESSGCRCFYGCATDADCGLDMACVPAGVLGEQPSCIPAACLTDANCGVEGLCGINSWVDDCGDHHDSLACAGLFEECYDDDDCGQGPCPDNPPDSTATFDYECRVTSEGWTCEAPQWCASACGRPFFVADEARTARAQARTDWQRCARPRPVDAAIAARLAAHWTQIGLFEHASIASFARALLQLLQLGAPPQLITAAREALADEVEHAQLTFGLASAYAGHAIGPGPIDTSGSLIGADDLSAIVEALVHEACIEETISAIEAQEAASMTTDPHVAEILERIAADELRHAQLGWRTLRWIFDAHPQLRGFGLDCLKAAIAEAWRRASVEPGEDDELLREHGVVDAALRRRIRSRALAAVIEPCAASLREHFMLDACAA